MADSPTNVTSLDRYARRAERQRRTRDDHERLRATLDAEGHCFPSRVYLPDKSLEVGDKVTREVEDFGNGVFLFHSSKGPVKVQRKRGRWSCGCTTWRGNRRQDCHHIEHVKRYLADLHASSAQSSRPVKTTVPYEHARRKPLPIILYPAGSDSEATRRHHARLEMPARVPDLAEALCRQIEVPEVIRAGNPGYPIEFQVYAMLMKQFYFCTYAELSHILQEDPRARRLGLQCKAGTDLVNTLYNIAGRPALIPILRRMMGQTARTGRRIERMVLIDGSGWPTSFSGDWFMTKYGRQKSLRKRVTFIKEHITIGPVTGLVPVVELSLEGGVGSADVVHYRTAMEEVLGIWPQTEYSVGDKSYGAKGNFIWCGTAGIWLVTLTRKHERRTGDRWPENAREMALLEDEFPELFDELYSPRNNVEAFPSRSKRRNPYRRLQHRKADPEITLPQIDDDDEKITMWPQEHLRQLVALQELSVGCARAIEPYSSHTVDNLRAIVMLEHLHDERVNFAGNFAFTPIPTLRMPRAA